MEIQVDKYKSDANRVNTFPAMWQIIRNIARWLAGLVIITAEDRIKAGISFGGEGRDG